MATIDDVALLARVSRSTVSRVLNDHPAVLAPIRAAVLRAIEELDYQPNPNARSLRTRRSRLIGLILPSLNAPVMPAVVEGAGEAVAVHGYLLTVGEVRHSEELQVRYVRELIARRVDGLLSQPVNGSGPVVALAEAAGIPILLLNRSTAHPRVPSMVLDEDEAFRAAFDELVQLGHRFFGTIGGTSQSGGGPARRRRLEAALKQSGLPPPLEWIVEDGAGQVRHAAEALLSASPRPTALFVGQPGLLPLLGVLREARLEIPADVSVVAYGEPAWLLHVGPGINVIASDHRENNRAATELLIQHIEGNEAAPRVLHRSAHYLRRGSVAEAQRTAKEAIR